MDLNRCESGKFTFGHQSDNCVLRVLRRQLLELPFLIELRMLARPLQIETLQIDLGPF